MLIASDDKTVRHDMEEDVELSRRHVLAGSLMVGATSIIPTSANKSTAAQAIHLDTPQHFYPFMHGVASGDPLPTSVILWTRVTPQP